MFNIDLLTCTNFVFTKYRTNYCDNQWRHTFLATVTRERILFQFFGAVLSLFSCLVLWLFICWSIYLLFTQLRYLVLKALIVVVVVVVVVVVIFTRFPGNGYFHSTKLCTINKHIITGDPDLWIKNRRRKPLINYSMIL